MSYLYHLLSWRDERDIPVFCWPFDGWEVPPRHHVLVEVYPTLYHRGFRSDEEEAKACVTWAAQRDEADSLLKQPLRARDDLAKRRNGGLGARRRRLTIYANSRRTVVPRPAGKAGSTISRRCNRWRSSGT